MRNEIITKYNDIFEDTLPRNYIFKDLHTQLNMYYTAMILNDRFPKGKLNYMNSSFNQLPDCYSKLSSENKISIYMQVSHKQQKELAWKQYEHRKIQHEVFGKELRDAINHCENLETMLKKQ